MTHHINLINGTITVDLFGWIVTGMLLIFFSFLSMLLFLLALKMRQITDRYRLRYGFDKDIEKKEMNKPTEDRLNNKEKYFKRRTFTD